MTWYDRKWSALALEASLEDEFGWESRPNYVPIDSDEYPSVAGLDRGRQA